MLSTYRTCMRAFDLKTNTLVFSTSTNFNSGSWCPRFLRKRPSHRGSGLFRSDRSKSALSSNRDSVVSGVSSMGEADAVRGDDQAREQSLFMPFSSEAEVRGDNCWGSHEVRGGTEGGREGGRQRRGVFDLVGLSCTRPHSCFSCQ